MKQRQQHLQQDKGCKEFETAANDYAQGMLKCSALRQIAYEFTQSLSKESLASSLKNNEVNTQCPQSDSDIHLNLPISPELSARRAIQFIAERLGATFVDPLEDIYMVATVIETLAPILTDEELEKAEIFMQLGYEQSVLRDKDPSLVSSEASDLRNRIREAATNYLKN